MSATKIDPFKELTDTVISFRDERDWKQFHNPKDIAISLCLEANEVMEHFQWKTSAQAEQYVKENKDKIGDELADVLYLLLTMSHELNINLDSAFRRKMKQNAQKYPVEKVKGKNNKYTEY